MHRDEHALYANVTTQPRGGGVYLKAWRLVLSDGSLTGRKMRDELTFLNCACSHGYSRIMGSVKSKVMRRPSTISLHRSSLRGTQRLLLI